MVEKIKTCLIAVGIAVVFFFIGYLYRTADSKDKIDIEQEASNKADSLHYFQSTPDRQQQILDSLTAKRSKER